MAGAKATAAAPGGSSTGPPGVGAGGTPAGPSTRSTGSTGSGAPPAKGGGRRTGAGGGGGGGLSRQQVVTADSIAGFLLGLMAWSWLGLPFLRGGASEVKKTLKAKFFNKAPDGSWLP